MADAPLPSVIDMTATPLGENLRARRAQVRPQDVGVATHGSRRVPGLRREEVALLACERVAGCPYRATRLCEVVR
jgi:hypothetical protein